MSIYAFTYLYNATRLYCCDVISFRLMLLTISQNPTNNGSADLYSNAQVIAVSFMCNYLVD